MNSWVTGPRSAPPILRSEALTSSFLSFCQNWYTQPRASSATNVSAGMRVEDLLQCVAPFGREAQPDARVVEAEDPREDLGREACGDGPRVWLAQIGGELLAVGERHRRAELRVEQQAVLGEEPREQQPVPLLVRALRDEQVAVVAQLAPLRAKPIAEGRLRGIEVFRTPVGEHAEALDGSARRRLRGATGGEDRRFQLLSEEGGQGSHGWPQMITVVPASRCDWTSARSWSKYGVGSSPGLKVADGGFTSTLFGSSFLAAR